MYEQIETIYWDTMDHNGGLLFGDYMLTFINDEWVLMTFSDNGHGHAGSFKIYKTVKEAFQNLPNAKNLMLDIIDEFDY